MRSSEESTMQQNRVILWHFNPFNGIYAGHLIIVMWRARNGDRKKLIIALKKSFSTQHNRARKNCQTLHQGGYTSRVTRRLSPVSFAQIVSYFSGIFIQHCHSQFLDSTQTFTFIYGFSFTNLDSKQTHHHNLETTNKRLVNLKIVRAENETNCDFNYRSFSAGLLYELRDS